MDRKYMEGQEKMNKKMLNMIRKNLYEIKLFKKKEAVRLEMLKEIGEEIQDLKRMIYGIKKEISRLEAEKKAMLEMIEEMIEKRRHHVGTSSIGVVRELERLKKDVAHKED